MIARFRWLAIAAALAVIAIGLLAPARAIAHGLTFTRVEVSFFRAGEIDVTIDYNLALVLPQPAAYYPLTQSSAETQQAAIGRAVPDILDALRLYSGNELLQLKLQDFKLPKLEAAAFEDPGQDKSTVLRFVATLPAQVEPLVLYIPYGARIDHPVSFSVINKTEVLSQTWIEEGASEPFDWSNVAPRPAWYREFATYLRLGFLHIVPEGVDHILFVLALFFLGLTWRKLIAQTTVFTIAHATTLFLSQYGILTLPSRYIEPLIAFSIACIAIENIYWPKLGPARLGLVFAFGLVHGLGFASSLSEVQFPRSEFLLALLGFNLGVDVGQLFVLALAFFAVGWFRNKPWFHSRITVPCCLLIAAVGLFWTVERIVG